MNITRRTLEQLWEQATTLGADSPLHSAIITEALEGGTCNGDATRPDAESDVGEASGAVEAIASDCYNFMAAIDQWRTAQQTSG